MCLRKRTRTITRKETAGQYESTHDFCAHMTSFLSLSLSFSQCVCVCVCYDVVLCIFLRSASRAPVCIERCLQPAAIFNNNSLPEAASSPSLWSSSKRRSTTMVGLFVRYSAWSACCARVCVSRHSFRACSDCPCEICGTANIARHVMCVRKLRKKNQI